MRKQEKTANFLVRRNGFSSSDYRFQPSACPLSVPPLFSTVLSFRFLSSPFLLNHCSQSSSCPLSAPLSPFISPTVSLLKLNRIKSVLTFRFQSSPFLLITFCLPSLNSPSLSFHLFCPSDFCPLLFPYLIIFNPLLAPPSSPSLSFHPFCPSDFFPLLFF